MDNLSPEAIEQRAQETLRYTAALSIPVDLNKVAGALNVSLRYEVLEDHVSGALIVKPQERHLIVNAKHHPNRQRFTIAHELGHLQLHVKNKERLFIDTELRVYQRVGQSTAPEYKAPGSTTTPEEERQANAFAAALLMPAPFVQRASLERDLWDELDVASLARAFGVSEQAMSIRLQQLHVLELA